MINKQVFELIDFVKSNDGIGNKAVLIDAVQKRFGLTKDRSVFYSESLAIRFSSSHSTSFSNTVLSLSNLQKYDELPFIICLVTPQKNFVYLANSTFLLKISHSSQELREDNIRGSFNGSDISKEFNSIFNSPEHFEDLFAIHEEIGFSGNLARLVEATTGISPSGKKFELTPEDEDVIKLAPQRATDFVNSSEYDELKNDLDKKVEKYKNNLYNTYMIKGLPPTPISMASLSSIEAAINSVPGNYLYFVANSKTSHYFSKTYEEHLEMINILGLNK